MYEHNHDSLSLYILGGHVWIHLMRWLLFQFLLPFDLFKDVNL